MQRPVNHTPRRPQPPRRTDNPRLIALNVLQDVSRGGAYAALALSQRLRESRLTPRDRNLVTELVYGTLERQITLDYFLDRLMERPDIECLVRDILRMGAYQILYLTRIPESAAVDESVSLARMLDRAPFTGLVNGVLRSLAREKNSLPWPDPQTAPVLAIAIAHSLPSWIVERLLESYSAEEAGAIAGYMPTGRHITVRRTPDRMTTADFEAMMTRKNWQWTPGRLPGVYAISGAGDVGLDKEYLQGLYSVQSESSMLAAMAVAPARGNSVLDACAAPGGKTAVLSELLHGTGRVYAWDVHAHRVELIRGMVRRLKLDNVRPAERDATVVREDMTGAMDAVLLDAPCSGLGVMLSKPDVKLRQTPESVSALVTLQRQLLDACCQYVRPGGALVYATCTILPEENIRQVEAFLDRHPEFERDDTGLRAVMPDFVREHIEEGTVQLQAYRDGAEGFFIARLKRKRV